VSSLKHARPTAMRLGTVVGQRGFAIPGSLRKLQRILLAFVTLCFGAILGMQPLPAHALGKPTVAVKEVQVQGIDREHLRLRVILTMENSNPLPIPLSRIQFLARIEDQQVATGETVENVRLPALGSAEATFRVLIPLRAIPGALERGVLGLIGEGLRYEIEGSAELGGLFNIPFTKAARFTRAQLMQGLRGA